MISTIDKQFAGFNQLIGLPWPALDRERADAVKGQRERAEIRLAAEGEAQRLQALREFSHDMRTPLASILVLCEQLYANGSSPHETAGRISGHARQLMRMMDGFIALSRIESATLCMTERLMQDLLDDSVGQVRDLAEQRGVKLDLAHAAPCYFVQVAADLMVRALTNLLVNAVKYGEPGSTIQIRCSPVRHARGLAVQVEVCNQIATVPAEGAFFTESCGLGLDFARKVLALHEGQLDLDLGEAGQARARLTLPAEIELM